MNCACKCSAAAAAGLLLQRAAAIASRPLPPEGSAAVAAARLLGPGARVVSSFRAIGAAKPRAGEPADCDVLVLSDDPEATFIPALVTGQGVTDLSQNVFAGLGREEVRLTAPVFEGDTIHSRPAVLELRTSQSRPNVGIVAVRTVGFNQDGVSVISFRRTMTVCRRGQGPTISRPKVAEEA